MNTAEWQKRLEDNFLLNGKVSDNLLAVYDQENKCGDYFINTFHGQNVLINSFQSFFADTIDSAFIWISKHGWPEDRPYYSTILLYYIILFRSFRACENLLLNGYPLDGYALIRDLKDRAIFIAGIAHNITTFPSIYGYEAIKAIKDDDWKKIKNRRKSEEYRVLNKILRKDSGLPNHVQEELKIWEELFHEEVHGSKLSFLGELGNWKNNNIISIGPLPRESSMAMYMNRSSEIGWLIVRLLPYLQLAPSAFGDSWQKKLIILDDSFRHMEQGISRMGKKIADAFLYFVDTKFYFPESFHYFEADGRG
jgi:hypothetical protein